MLTRGLEGPADSEMGISDKHQTMASLHLQTIWRCGALWLSYCSAGTPLAGSATQLLLSAASLKCCIQAQVSHEPELDTCMQDMDVNLCSEDPWLVCTRWTAPPRCATSARASP